ncbi:MAG TPA: ABC transporter ATP-binding protein, partial [bacterium]
MKIVEINKLKKSFRQGFFGRRFLALKGLSFSVEKGEVYGLLGPNGAGKTTTIKILTGLLSADSGGIKILGEPIGAPRIREKIGFLPENPQFHDFLTGEEFLNFHSNLLGMPRYGRKEKIKELFNAVGLKGAGD